MNASVVLFSLKMMVTDGIGNGTAGRFCWWIVLQVLLRIMFDEIQILFTSIPYIASHTILIGTINGTAKSFCDFVPVAKVILPTPQIN